MVCSIIFLTFISQIDNITLDPDPNWVEKEVLLGYLSFKVFL